MIQKASKDKNLKYYVIILFLSLLPLASLYTTSKLIHTHDGLVHLPRIAAYYKALVDGQIPVRWAGDLNYGYGMPLFNFIYHLPYIVSSFLIFLGFGLVNSFKITLGVSYLLSGIFMFAFTKEFFNDNRKALLATIFYQFASFRLVEIITRGAFGEVYTYAFLPAVLFGLTRLFKKYEFKSFVYISVATALLILSHNSISLVFFAISIGFLVFFAGSKKIFLLGLTAIFFGLALSTFYWLPAIFEHKYTYGDLFMRKVYLSNFPPLINLFIPNIIYSQTFVTGKVPVQIGLFHEIALILSVIVLMSKEIDIKLRRLVIFCILIVVMSLFFMQPVSKPLWAQISMLRQFQFPWRFLSAVVFATSLLSVSFLSFDFFKKKLVYLTVLFLVILSSIFYWRPPEGFDKIDEGYYWNYPLNTTYYGETDVIWSAGPKSAYPASRVEAISGEGKISNFTKKSNLHTFLVEAKTDLNLVDHTQYFPGWRVYVDQEKVPIQFQDPNHRGEIEFSVPKGKHEVRAKFEESKIRLIADVISIMAFALLASIYFSTKIKKRFLKL